MFLFNIADKKDNQDKPERPPKPEALVLPSNPPGHHRTASEGSIIDHGT